MRKILSLLLTMMVYCLIQLELIAQEHNYFIYPQKQGFENYKSSVGLALANLPEDQVEEASTFIRGPLFNYQALYGLPSNFQIYGALHTNIVTFHFSLGPRWQYHINKFAFAPGYDIAYWFGELNQFGFKSKVNGWIHYPNLTIGYKFEKFSLSLKSELIVQTALNEKSDDVEIESETNTVPGFTVGLYLEQPLWKNNYFLIGVKINYTKFYYPTWAAFPTFNRYFYIPEFIIGFNL